MFAANHRGATGSIPSNRYKAFAIRLLCCFAGYSKGRYSNNRCFDKEESTAGWFGSVHDFWDRQGESEWFRCVGNILAEIYKNTTTLRNSSV